MRLLIVEDDQKLLAILSHHLTVAGHHVRTATNGKQALAALAQNPVDMVLTDWKMPEMSGIELCQALRSAAATRNLYIIMLTGQASDPERIEGFAAGADDYITKPFDLGRLMAGIRTGMQILARSGAAA